MDWLNSVVTYIKHDKIVNATVIKASSSIKQHLTKEQILALPERFEAFTLPVATAFIAIVDSRTLRRPCFHNRSQTVRWKHMFRCVESVEKPTCPDDDDKNRYVVAARKHETTINADIGTTFWPYQIPAPKPELLPVISTLSEPIMSSLNKYGVACIPISQTRIQTFTAQIETYLKRMMRIPENMSILQTANPEFLLRNSKHAYSRHIRPLSGHTYYGYHSEALHNLFKEIEFIVQCLISPLPLWITSAKINLRFPELQ
jgi:hypothetical protein